MISRKEFIRLNAAALGASVMVPSAFWKRSQQVPFVSQRPPISERTFVSEAVEATINRIMPKIRDAELAWMFENCFPNTLDTTVDFEMVDGKPDTFIITGDIDAMWLRDSTAQVWPYMPLLLEDDRLRLMVRGLVHRQANCILTDPYANAFYKDLTKVSEWADDRPKTLPGVHERKWEIDSLCYFVRLSYDYYSRTQDIAMLDEQWQQAARLVVETFQTEQRKDGTTPYRFIRTTANMVDSVPFGGTGRPIRPIGLIASAFRPSDDATIFPFLIPSNLFAVESLRQLAFLFENVLEDPNFARSCKVLADEVQQAVEEYALVQHPVFGEIYAYEVDGFGSQILMDDANVPSLMSLGYLGIHDLDDELYQNTRAYLLSDYNPYFLRGEAAIGQGSPHTGKESIWPMGIILRGMTATDAEEVELCLRMLKNTHADTGFMHESFFKDDAYQYTRSWFAWANTLFGELVLRVEKEFPEVL